MTLINSAYTGSTRPLGESSAKKQGAPELSQQITEMLGKLQIMSLLKDVKAKLGGGEQTSGSGQAGGDQQAQLSELRDKLREMKAVGRPEHGGGNQAVGGDHSRAGGLKDQIEAGPPRKGGAVESAMSGDIKGYEKRCMADIEATNSKIAQFNQKAESGPLSKDESKELLGLMKHGVETTKELDAASALQGRPQRSPESRLGSRIAELTVKDCEGSITKDEQKELKDGKALLEDMQSRPKPKL